MVSFALKWVSKRFLSDYLDGIDDIDIALHLFQGKLSLKNISLKKDLFNDIESPVVVHNSLIDEINVNIPWKKLSSEATSISVKNIFLLVRRKSEGFRDIPYDDRKIMIEKTKCLILQIIKLIGMDSVPKLNENEYYNLRSSEDIDVFHQKLLKSNEKGFLSKLINRVIDNALIEVENIHIRYEDEISNQSNPFSIGITLDAIQIYPVLNNEKTFFEEYEESVERKIEVRNIAAYLNSFNEQKVFTKQNEIPSQFSENMKSMIYKDNNTSIKDIFAHIDESNELIENSYILTPLSFDAYLTLNRANTILKPNVSLSLDLNQIQLKLNRDQYSRTLDMVSSYNKYYRIIKFGYYAAPKRRPSESPDEWWRYIIRCVKTRIRENNKNTSVAGLVKKVKYINIHRRLAYNGNITNDEKLALNEYDHTYSLSKIIENRKISKMSVEKDIIEGNLKKLSFIEKLDTKLKLGALISIFLLLNVILGPYIGIPLSMAIIGGMYYKNYFSIIMNQTPPIPNLDQREENMEKISQMIEINQSNESEHHKVLKTKRILLGNTDENSFQQLFEDYITEQIAKSNEFVKFKSKLNIGMIGLTLEQNPLNQLLRVEIDHIHHTSIMRVSSASHSASIKDIFVKELITSKDVWNDILTKRKTKVNPLPSDQLDVEIERKEERMLIDGLFEINPHDKNDIDIFVRLETSRFDVTVNKRYIDGLLPFFIPSYKNVNEIKDVTQAGVKYAVKTAEESVKKAIRDKKRILLDIVVLGPKIHIPKLDDKEVINEVVLSSGRLEIKSNPKSVMHSDVDLTQISESFYDKYNIYLYDINCNINKHKRIDDNVIVEKMTILHNFAIQSEIDVCIIGNENMPKLIFDIGMKKMFISISKNRIETIMDILKSQLTQPPVPIEDKELITKPPKNKLNTIDADIRRQLQLDILKKVTYVPFASILKLHAWIGYISIELIEDRIPIAKGKKISPSMMSLLEVCISNFNADINLTTHYNDVSVTLNNFMIVEYISTNYHNNNKFEKTSAQEYIQKRMALKVEELDKIIEDNNGSAEKDSDDLNDFENVILEQSEKNYILRCVDKYNLIKIDITNIPEISPKYKQIDNSVSIKVGDIEINVIRQAIAYMLLHVKKIMKSIEKKKFTPSPSTPKLEPEENITKQKIEECEKLIPKESSIPNQYEPNRYLAEILFELSKINICLNKEGRTFTSIFVENIEVGSSVRSDSSLSVTGCLHRLGIQHIDSMKVIRPILQIKSGRAIQFTYSMINPNADDYGDHDMAVSLVVDVLDFIFINNVIQELVLYANQLVVMLLKVGEMLESKAHLNEKEKRKSMKKMKSHKVVSRPKVDSSRRKTLSSAQGEEVKKKLNELNHFDALDEEIDGILKDRDNNDSDIETPQKSKTRRSKRLSRALSTPKDKSKSSRKSSNFDKPVKHTDKLEESSTQTKPLKIKLNVNVQSPRIIVPKSSDGHDNGYLALSLGTISVSNQFKDSEVDGLFDNMEIDISNFNLHVYDKEHDVDKSMIKDFKCSVDVSRLLVKRNKEVPNINVNVKLDPFIIHMSQIHAKTIVHILVYNLKDNLIDKDMADLQSYFHIKSPVPLKSPSKKSKRKTEKDLTTEVAEDGFSYNIDEFKNELLMSLDNFSSLKQEEESEENIRCNVNIEAIHFHLEDDENVILSLSMHQIHTDVSILTNQSMFVDLNIYNLEMKDHMNEKEDSFNYLISREKNDKILSLSFIKYSNNNKELSCTWSNTDFIFIDETFANILKRWKSTIQGCLDEMSSNMTNYESVNTDELRESASKKLSSTPATPTFTKVNFYINDIKLFILNDRSKSSTDAISLHLSDTSLVLLLNDVNQHIVSEFQMNGLSFKKSVLEYKEYQQTKIEHIMYPFNLGILFFMKDGIDVILSLKEFNFILSYKDLILVKDAVENRLLPLFKELSFENKSVVKANTKSNSAISAPPTFKKIKVHTKFTSILIGLIDDRYVNDFFLPLLRFKVGVIDISFIMPSLISQLIKININDVDAYSFNNNMSGWESIIEPYHCGINMKKTNNDIAVELNSLDALNINLTGDLINTCFNTLEIVNPRKKFDVSTFNESYPVLVRNRVGKRIDVDVIFGDEKLLSSSIDDLNDLPIMLNRNDRLSGVRDNFYYQLRVLVEQQSNAANFIQFNKVESIIMPYNVGGTSLNYLCEIELINGTRVITFHGGIKFINDTSYDMVLCLHEENKRKSETLKRNTSIKQKEKSHSRESSLNNDEIIESDKIFTFKKNDCFFIPILKNHIRSFSVQVDGFQSSNVFKFNEEDSSNFTFICNSNDPRDNKVWVCNCSSRLSKNKFDYTITFEPKISIENLLTVPVDIMVGLKGSNQNAEKADLSKHELKKLEKEKKKKEKELKKKKEKEQKKSKKENKTNDEETVTESDEESFSFDVKSAEGNIHPNINASDKLDIYVFNNFDERLSLSIKLDQYKWSSYMRIMEKSNKVGKFALQNNENSQHILKLYGDLSIGDTGRRKIKIYALYWIINDSGLKLEYATSKDSQALKLYNNDDDNIIYETSDQRKWYHDTFLKNEAPCKYYYYGEKKLYLKLDDSSWSKQVTLGTRDEGVVSIEDQKTRRRYIFHIKYEPAPAKFWRTTVINIAPAYWVYNKSKHDIFVEQFGSTNTYQKIKKNMLIPYHFPDYKKDNELVFSVGEKSVYSNPVSVNIVGRFPLKIQKVNSHEYFFFTLVIKKETGSATEIVIEDDVEESYYKICNNTKYDVVIRENKSELTSIVKSRKSVPFSFSCPQETKKHIYLKFLGDKVKEDENEWIKVNIGKVSEFDPATVGKDKINMETVSKGRLIELVLTPKYDKKKKHKKSSSSDLSIIEDEMFDISESETTTTTQEDNNNLSLTVQLNIASVGISLIDDTPQEVMYIYLSDIDIFYKLDNEEQSLEAKMSFQIDNALYSTPYPIILHQSNPKDSPPLIHFAFYKDERYKNIACFRYLAFKMNEIDFKVDEAFLMYLLYWSTTIVDNMAKLNPLYLIEQDVVNEKYKNSRRPVISEEDQSSQTSSAFDEFFFEAFHLNPIHINVSFSPTSNYDQPQLQEDIAELFGRIMSLVTAIDRAPIRLSGLLLKNSFATKEEFSSRVIDHYTTMFIRQAFAVLGSTDFLGNPVSLISSLGTGAYEFVHEPAAGMVASPKEFGKGLAKGTSSLLKNTLGGVLNSAQKIVGSVGNLGAKITFDQEYRKEREVQKMKKAKHVGEGLGYGIKEFGSGLYKGVTGLISQPVKGVQKEGIKGLGKGVAKGIVGVVLKPTVGVVDLVSRTAEGIKNTAYIMDGESLRVRYPRNISNQLLVSPYDPIKSEGQFLLKTVAKGKYRHEFYVYHKLLDKKSVLLVSNTHIMVLKMSNLEKIKIADKWSIHWRVKLIKLSAESIEKVKGKKSISIILKEKSESIAVEDKSHDKSTKIKVHKIKCENEEIAAEVLDKVQSFIKYASLTGGTVVKKTSNIFKL